MFLARLRSQIICEANFLFSSYVADTKIFRMLSRQSPNGLASMPTWLVARENQVPTSAKGLQTYFENRVPSMNTSFLYSLPSQQYVHNLSLSIPTEAIISSSL